MAEQRVPLPISISGAAPHNTEGGIAVSKFDVRSAGPTGRGPLETEAVPSGRTHERGAGIEAGLAARWAWEEPAADDR
jgi:hypothetical protein